MAGSNLGILIRITSTRGSTPRDIGATLWVNAKEIAGSIGGGALEADAIAKARQMLIDGAEKDSTKTTLGPEIGQCCGGVVELSFERSTRPETQAQKLAIFGAGHVGARLATLAKAIPMEVEVYDNRPSIELDQPISYQYLERPEAQIRNLAMSTNVIILTHDHALDFRLAEAALLRDDLGFIGMIGSKSKAATFRSQFRALGERLTRLHSPIAKKSPDKRPAIIALAVLNEILTQTKT